VSGCPDKKGDKMNAKVGQYTLERDIEDLAEDKCMVVAYSVLPSYGYIIFWYDKEGYSVTVREGTEREEKAFSCSGAMPYNLALDHYLACIESVTEKRYSR